MRREPRYCCMRCDALLPVGAERCVRCGAVVADMKFNMRSNFRAAKLAAQEVVEEQRRSSAYLEEQKRLDHEPVSAVIVSSEEKTETRGSVIDTGARMLVGGALLGPAGVVLGAATGSKRTYTTGQKVTFAVKYASGRKGTETVEVGSRRFKELAELLVE